MTDNYFGYYKVINGKLNGCYIQDRYFVGFEKQNVNDMKNYYTTAITPTPLAPQLPTPQLQLDKTNAANSEYNQTNTIDSEKNNIIKSNAEETMRS